MDHTGSEAVALAENGLVSWQRRLERMLSMRLYLLRFRDLLCARGVAFFLICGVSFCLFLRRLLVCGFRRFITHDPQVKIQDEQSQYGHLDDFTL